MNRFVVELNKDVDKTEFIAHAGALEPDIAYPYATKLSPKPAVAAAETYGIAVHE